MDALDEANKHSHWAKDRVTRTLVGSAVHLDPIFLVFKRYSDPFGTRQIWVGVGDILVLGSAEQNAPKVDGLCPAS